MKLWACVLVASSMVVGCVGSNEPADDDQERQEENSEADPAKKPAPAPAAKLKPLSGYAVAN